MGGDKLIPHLLRIGEDDPRVQTLGDRHDRIFREQYIDGIQPLPGVTPFIERLAAEGFRIALATSAKSDELEHYVALLHLDGRLAATVSKADVGQTKPAPEIFAIACQKLDIRPEQAIAVGDSVWDVEAAKRLNMRLVGVCTGGFGADELRAAGATVYRDLPELFAQWTDSPFSRPGRGTM
jgi:membrane protein